MPLTDKQREYLQNCNHRWNVKTGATGSGKSYVDMAVTIPQRILACRGEGLIVLLGNTQGSLNRNILEPMREIWPGLVSDIHSNNTVDIFGKRCYALGADNKKHRERIQGATMEYVYGDEVTTWAEDVFTMLKSRLRCAHSRFDGTCNPDSPNHWFKKFLDSDADIYQQGYNIDDGALPENIIQELKKEYANTVYYDRFILGKWALAEGRIYDMFDESVHVVDDSDRNYTAWKVSMDYGTQNPTAMILWGKSDGVWYAVKEFYYSGRDERKQRTDEGYYYDLCKLVGERHASQVIIDPSAASMIACINSRGRFTAIQAKNEVIDGIRNTASALNGGKILICRQCVNAIREFGSYVWDKKASLLGEDKPLKENDHAMDAIRYFVQTVLQTQKARVSSRYALGIG